MSGWEEGVLESRPAHFNQTHHKLAAAVLSGGLLVSNAVLLAPALAVPPKPESTPVTGQVHMLDIGKLAAKQSQKEAIKQRRHILLSAQHEQIVKKPSVSDELYA